MSDLLPPGLLQALVVAAYLVLAVGAGGHALLTQRDPRTAWGWIAVCWLFPLAGPFLYYVLGINRVRTRARVLRGAAAGPDPAAASRADPAEPLIQLVRIGDTLTQRPRLAGNRVRWLRDGEEAYPAMLDAIARAREQVCLATYIFEADAVGEKFTEALAQATARGVEVRVLVDGVGELYSWPRAVSRLRQRGLRAARFLPPRLWPPMLYVNMRNHRKLLIADGRIAFTGGMNIGGRHLADKDGRRLTDLHFEIRGPVVSQLAQAYAADWLFATGESLALPEVAPAAGDAVCRVITDGPDEDLDKLSQVILGAVAVAHRQVLIMTPYFIPSPELTAALQGAALRGVEVAIVLPARSNLRYVDHASRRGLPPLLERGVRIYLQPPPFAHTKLLIVDGRYAQIGSANLDPRSLRLNFEIVVEVFDAAVCTVLEAHIEAARRESREVGFSDLARRSLPARLRDGLFWLFSPYL